MQSDTLSRNLSLSQPKAGAERQGKNRLKIAIIGLGRIGRSIGLALRQGANFELVGHDKDQRALQQARKDGAVERTEWNLINTVENADMIVLAIPLGEIEDTLKAIGNELKPGAVITDTATLKTPVQRWAEEYLSDSVHFIGGNPILPASSDDSEEASATLFKEGLWCLCPTVATDETSVMVMSNFATWMGAKPLFLEAAEHDGLITGAEYFPAITAAALATTLGKGPGWQEMRKLAGTQFNTGTQIREVDFASLSQACLDNRENLIRWLDRMIASLTEWRAALSKETSSTLKARFEAAAGVRDRWQADRGRGDWEEKPAPVDIPTSGTYIRGLFGLRGRGKDNKDRKDDRAAK